MTAGTYGGAVTIASAGATGSPRIIPVTLTVTDPPAAFPQISLNTITAPGFFTQPVHVSHAGDGSGRIFVVEQAGRIRILDNGAVRPTPFLDIASRVACCGEQGLLSVAFPPHSRTTTGASSPSGRTTTSTSAWGTAGRAATR